MRQARGFFLSLLEIEFGEALTPGPRIQRNAADLRARGREREAKVLEAYEPVRRRGKDSEADRQQAARTKLPLGEFRGGLLAAVRTGLRLGFLPRALATGGFSVAIGNRNGTLMAVHDETGMALPFEGSVEIASGGNLEIAPSVIAQLHHNAPPLPQARREGAARTLKRAERDLAREIDRGRFEAAADGEFDSLFSRMRRAREKAEADPGKAEQVQSMAELRRTTLATRRETALMRERRIDRAFRTARLWQSRRARKIAFALAAGGLLLTGAGLSVALGAGFVATVAMKGYGDTLRAQGWALMTQRRAAVTRSRSSSVSQAARAAIAKGKMADPPNTAPVAPTAARSRAPASFDFALVRKSQRVLAAMALEALLGEAFDRGRDFGAWLGLVPRQYSTGGRTVLGRISKQGNTYLRMLFIQAAKVIIMRPQNWEKFSFGTWLKEAAPRLHRNKLATALANKLARISWSVLRNGRSFDAHGEAVAI